MSILQAFLKWAPLAAQPLIDLLERAKTIAELAPLAQKIEDALNAPLGPDNLAALAAIVGTELPNVLAGRINPREHPSDLAG